MDDLVYRARLQVAATVVLSLALAVLVVAAVAALEPILGFAESAAAVGGGLALLGIVLILIARRSEPPRPAAVPSNPSNPWVGVLAHAAAVGLVMFTDKRR
ncbi:MAG: hypothetical protein ACOC3D_05110 [Pseudomonadota bacterium]